MNTYLDRLWADFEAGQLPREWARVDDEGQKITLPNGLAWLRKHGERQWTRIAPTSRDNPP